MLECPVRDCRRALQRDLQRQGRRVYCAAGHSFDVARSGYLNLLQPQDRKSKHPGDSAKVVAARRRLHERGLTEPLLRGIGEFASVSRADSVLDAGCGDGYYMGTLARETGFDGHGVDISIPAIEAAARRYPECEWIVANADRFIPYKAGSFSLALSITGRMNAGEFRRVLKDGGRLLVAISAADDLIELRGTGRDRVARTLEIFAASFRLAAQGRVTTTADLEAAAVRDVLDAVYRPLRPRSAAAMRVTFSLDLLLFEAV